MKKLLAFIAALLVLGCFVYADVSVKDVGGGNAEVTFFYGNPRATEVVVAGTWTDWQNGAIPMTKVEKGWEYKVIVPVATEMKYKFISDGNWTTDLKAPEFVDDGFGGKNGFVDVAALVAASKPSADGAAAAPSGKIKFVCWTMFGAQAQFNTSAETDPSEKGIDLDNATVGSKTYAKFTGNFIGNNPFFIELALMETDLDPIQGGAANTNYLYDIDKYGNEVVSWEDGLKNLGNGLASDPLAYLARANDNSGDSAGPGSNPFLGHLKFGFNTPYVKYLTGFNYAKPDLNKTILWTTVDGAWDAGYQHVGGFNAFSLGDKLTQIGDVKVNLTIAPNKSADRKGTKYGMWAFANADYNGFVSEVQYNTFYTGDTLFDKPFEHDFIVGTKGKVAGVSYAAQALINVYQNLDQVPNGEFWNMMAYTGYSRSAVLLSEDFDATKHLAGQVQASYALPEDLVGVTLGYRFRGLESNMLYVTDHHNDYGKDVQSAQLGTLNSQRISLDAYVNPTKELKVTFSPYVDMPFTTADWDEYYALYSANSTPNGRWDFKSQDSMNYVAKLGADYDLSAVTGMKSSVSVYGKVKYNTEEVDKFSGYDSNFLFSNAGLKLSFADVTDTVKGLDFYYGMNDTASEQMFNTFILSAALPMDIGVDLGFGLRTNDPENDADNNYPIGFSFGAKKKIARMYKPTVYAQFVYDMDPYKSFGDGQDQLNLDGYGVGDKSIKDGADDPCQDAVEVYKGAAAARIGIRWDL